MKAFTARIHRLIAQRGAVFELQLEAARGAQARHRRRREHHDEGVLDTAERLVQLAGHGATALVGARALGKGLERGEHDAGVGAVGKAVDRQAGEGNRVFHVRVLLHDLAHARITSSVRSSVAPSGSCAKPIRYCLSCAGTKPPGTDLEQADGRTHQRQVDHQHQRLARR